VTRNPIQPPVECKCETCGKQFRLRACRVRQGKGRFCSPGCKVKGQADNIDRPCINCGVALTVRPSEMSAGRKLYCSSACYREHRREQKAALATLKTCPACGNQFPRTTVHEYRKVVCSPECAKAYYVNTMDDFHSLVQKRGEDECWIWTGPMDGKRYGVIGIGGKQHKAHALAYEVAHGPITKGLFACHKCDNPSCCNPSHIFIGTAADNAADMKAKKRSAWGERAWAAKLTTDAVRQIRTQRASGMSATALAGMYGVTPAAISKVALGRTWSNVT
jgi:hypothetical protein